MNEKIETLQKWIDESRRIVFFGGAGVSTESGIPDFRSTGGLYNQEYDYPPETIVSATFFQQNPGEFYRFYRDRMIYQEAKPNAAHLKLAELEKAGKLTAIVTQNIDGLHQAAGSRNVLELHGSVKRNHCIQCGKFYPLSAVTGTDGIPRCEHCGGLIKPDVVLYEEALDEQVLSDAVDAIYDCDLLIIGGTSLSVYPAAGLIRYMRKNAKLCIVNLSATSADDEADLVIAEGIDEVFRQIEI